MEGAGEALFLDAAAEEVWELEDTWLLEAEEGTRLEEDALDEVAGAEGAEDPPSPPLAAEQPPRQRAAASKRTNSFFTTTSPS